MRWKLLIVASLLAAVAGAGVCFAAAFFLLAPARTYTSPQWLAPAVLIAPLAATVYASVFVYRHTARRRALQAVMTALLILLLTLTALALGSIFTGRPTPEIFRTPSPSAKTS